MVSLLKSEILNKDEQIQRTIYKSGPTLTISSDIVFIINSFAFSLYIVYGLNVVEHDCSGLPTSLGVVLPKQPTEKSAVTMPDLQGSSSSLLTTTSAPSSKLNTSPLTEDGREFVCGWGAAFINITVTFPVNKLMFRQMLHGISTASAANQLRREGLKNLYRGILPPLCQKTVSTSVMFGMFDQYGKYLRYYHPQLPDGVTLALAATLAGCTEAILCPFERIQTVLQDKKFHGKYKNSLHITQELWKYGIREYYRGMVSILVRNGPSNVLFFGLRTEIKDILPNPSKSWWGHVLTDFVSGAFLGAFISTVMYPINVIKAHQQCQVGGAFQSMHQTFWDVYHARGSRLSRLFSGAHVNYTRALVSWGIINASYEILHKLLYS